MTQTSRTTDGKMIFWSEKNKRWEYANGDPWINDKEICLKCNKPRLDLNGVEDCDFCLQGLTSCDFIDAACCGHGDDSLAYISLQDGRRFVLDKMNW